MRLPALIDRLTELYKEHGDTDVYLDTGPNGLHEIGEIDYLDDESSVIIWGKPGEGGPVCTI